jgi:hypothetical protein
MGPGFSAFTAPARLGSRRPPSPQQPASSGLGECGGGWRSRGAGCARRSARSELGRAPGRCARRCRSPDAELRRRPPAKRTASANASTSSSTVVTSSAGRTHPGGDTSSSAWRIEPRTSQRSSSVTSAIRAHPYQRHFSLVPALAVDLSLRNHSLPIGAARSTSLSGTRTSGS